MKERPILFSAPMVLAILDGTKTQTRRIIKPQPDFVVGDVVGKHTPEDERFGRLGIHIRCRYGKVGDRIWVRETHAIVPRTAYAMSDGVQQTLRSNDDHDAAIYRAGWARSHGGIRWRSSLHMPRWASRILLEIVSIRAERLQDISEADALAEGINRSELLFIPCADAASALYSKLWESINGEGSWEANPWVWVIEFKRITP